jgi:hypothetical protein
MGVMRPSSTAKCPILADFLLAKIPGASFVSCCPEFNIAILYERVYNETTYSLG